MLVEERAGDLESEAAVKRAMSRSQSESMSEKGLVFLSRPEPK